MNFSDLKDLGKMKEMMSQAKAMQEQMEQKLAATVVSYVSGIPGGIFAPSLSIGAALGSVLAPLVPLAMCGIVLPLRFTLNIFFRASLLAFSTAGGTSLALP